jgi:DNA polymerase III delta prime subunit
MKTAQMHEKYILGSSLLMKQFRTKLMETCTSRVPILIEGEMGTGKSLTARVWSRNCLPDLPKTILTIHGEHLYEFSHTHDLYSLFESLSDTGSLPMDRRTENLIASQLITIESPRPETNLIDNLIIVLDDIDRFPINVQQICLLLIQSPQTMCRRIISTITPSPLSGNLLPEFYYSLKGLTLEIPPLRHRKEDIGELTIHFLMESALRMEHIDIDHKVKIAFRDYYWPGNVSELRHELMCAAQKSLNRDRVVRKNHLSSAFHQQNYFFQEKPFDSENLMVSQDKLPILNHLIHIGISWSHILNELKDPVTEILGWIDLTLMGEVLSKDELLAIQRKILLCRNILHDAVNFSDDPIESMEPCTLLDVLLRALRYLKISQIPDIFDMVSFLQRDDLLKLRGSFSSLKFVFVNLIQGTFMAAQEQHRHCKMIVSYRLKSGYHIIEIRDVGAIVKSEMSTDKSPKPKHRSLSTFGAQLGLATSQRIIEYLGGVILKDQTDPKSSAFIVKLPKQIRTLKVSSG